MRPKTLSGASGFFLAGALLYSYGKGILPLTDIYVRKPDFLYYAVYFLIGLIGIYLLSVAFRSARKISVLVRAAVFLFGIPILFYVLPPLKPAWDYAPHRLEMIGLGFLPVVAAGLGLLVLKGRRLAGLALALVFTAIAVYHAVLSVRMALREGGAFSAGTTSTLTIGLGIIVLSVVFATAGFLAFKGNK